MMSDNMTMECLEKMMQRLIEPLANKPRQGKVDNDLKSLRDELEQLKR